MRKIAVLVAVTACLVGLAEARRATGTPPARAVSTMPRPAPDRRVLAGRVSEAIDVGYTYLRLTLDDGADAWVVTAGAAPVVGDRVTARVFGRADTFTSKRLDGRTFSPLFFAVVTTADG